MAELVDARDLKSLESNLVPVRLRPWAENMHKNIIIILLSICLGGCAKSIIPMPGSVMPERNNRVLPPESYGNYPDNYQQILKIFLQNKIANHEDAKVDFINKPSQMSVSQFGNDFSGYRVCLSVNARNKKSVYTGYKTHLFIIKDEKIILHLFDSGLLKIPFDLCVDTDESKTMYLDDIPDEKEEMTINEMDKIKIDEKNTEKYLMKNIYILCSFDSIERTFVFNENNKILSESIGIDEMQFDNVQFSETHILGLRLNEEILINRISGSATSTKSKTSISTGVCELLNSKKF